MKWLKEERVTCDLVSGKYIKDRRLWAAIAGKSVVEEWGYLWVLKAEESGWDGQREQRKVFQAVGHRISKDQMAGRSIV